jgi:hypothetical protein
VSVDCYHFSVRSSWIIHLCLCAECMQTVSDWDQRRSQACWERDEECTWAETGTFALADLSWIGAKCFL